MTKPLCFMVMPYGRKRTLADAGKGPAEIDFNQLWDRAYVPVIDELGYEPVRADQDTGSLIVTEMLERLYFADLVLADMTLPNGNVYYEIGIRHAARESGCVLLAADWSKQLFDVAQQRTVRYPLPEGEIIEATAQAVQAVLRSKVPGLVEGRSPVHKSIEGYPAEVNPSTASTMKGRMAEQAELQGRVRAVRSEPWSRRMAAAGRLAAEEATGSITPATAITLLLLLRSCVATDDDWKQVVAFCDRLPPRIRNLPEVREQSALAASRVGDHREAIEQLGALMEASGQTPERLGLLGGRYKRLLASASDRRDARELLNLAIESYEAGMELDLNQFYCASNLPRLYRQRDLPGDEDRAQTAIHLVMAACERALKRSAHDPWLLGTLLAAAIDAADAAKADSFAEQLLHDPLDDWQWDSLYGDLEVSVGQVRDEPVRERLRALIERLAHLLGAGEPPRQTER